MMSYRLNCSPMTHHLTEPRPLSNIATTSIADQLWILSCLQQCFEGGMKRVQKTASTCNTKASSSDNHGLYITHTFQVLLLLTTYHVEPLLAGCAPHLRLPMRIIDSSKITVLLATIFNILKFKSQSCFNLESIKRVGYLKAFWVLVVDSFPTPKWYIIRDVAVF